MSQKRELDTRESIRVVTSNEFVLARGLSSMSLKARKLLYLAISQCRKTDKNFYEYRISIPEFADLMEIAPSNLYADAYTITKELAGATISVLEEGHEKFTHYPLTSICEYDENSCLRIELNPRMTDFLLDLRGSFTKPLLEDFMKMGSPYSMAIWHLMQRDMHSRKPGVTDVIEFDLSLEELRDVTGTLDKLPQLVHFKERVLDKALREIRDNCGVDITYTNIKTGRTVTGFHFIAKSPFHIDAEKVPMEMQDRIIEFRKRQEKKEGETLGIR